MCHRISIIFIWFLFLMLSGVAKAQTTTSSYEELQAAYLYNFAKYIRWPDQIDVFVIGVYGKSPDILTVLERTIKGKKVSGSEIQIKVIKSIQEASLCHMVYLPEEESKQVIGISQAINGKTTLLVTEEDLIKKGAMISFVVENDMLKFKLKARMMTQSGLIVSEGLWKLAILL